MGRPRQQLHRSLALPLELRLSEVAGGRSGHDEIPDPDAGAPGPADPEPAAPPGEPRGDPVAKPQRPGACEDRGKSREQ